MLCTVTNKEKYYLAKQAGIFYRNIPKDERVSLYEGVWGPKDTKALPLHVGEHRTPRWLTSLFTRGIGDDMEEAARWKASEYTAKNLMSDPKWKELSDEDLGYRALELMEEASDPKNLNEEYTKGLGKYMMEKWPKRYGKVTASKKHQQQVLDEYSRLRRMSEGEEEEEPAGDVGLDLYPSGFSTRDT